MFSVESNVPLVAHARGRKPTQFPLDEMGVQDSFLIACDVENKKAVDSWRRKFAVAKKQFLALNEDAAFKTALVKDGMRVWRTA